MLILFDLIFAEISYEREDLALSETTIRALMPRIEKLKLTDLHFAATCLLVKICRAVRSHEEIDKLTARVKTSIMNNGHVYLLPNFHAFELRNRLANETPGVTEIFDRENRLYKDKPYYFLIYRHITFARALLSEAKFSEANLILKNIELLCRQYKRNMDLIEVTILQSVAVHGLGCEKEACHYLETAIDAARKCGFVRIFSDESVSIWPILNLVRKYRSKDTFVKKIIVSCKKALAHTKGGL